jgi:antitoxin CptB
VAARASPFYMAVPMLEARLKKISYRAWRRGFREADLILGAFADQRLPTMAESDADAFEILLDQPDHDLYGWIIGRAPAPAGLDGPMLAALRAFHLTIGQGEARGA